MTIFGVALLATCTLVGVYLGDLLGVLLGVKANVGGVGLAMMLCVVSYRFRIQMKPIMALRHTEDHMVVAWSQSGGQGRAGETAR